MKQQKSPQNDIRTSQKIVRGIDRALYIVVVIVLVALLAFGVYSIYDNRRIDTSASAETFAQYKPVANDTRSFGELVKINPDVCGWLTIDGTGVDYPLVQGRDNDTYMNTRPDKTFGLSGSLFLDCKNKRDFSDFNTIIYGHHMAHHAMFGDLDRFRKATYFKKLRRASVYYNGANHRLTLFAFLTVNAYDGAVYQIASDTGTKQAYLDMIKEKAMRYRDIGVTPDDHIVVMSTCMTDKTDGRYILVGKIGGIIKNAPKQQPKKLPWWFGRLMTLLVALAVLAVIIYLYIKRKKEQRGRRHGG